MTDGTGTREKQHPWLTIMRRCESEGCGFGFMVPIDAPDEEIDAIWETHERIRHGGI